MKVFKLAPRKDMTRATKSQLADLGKAFNGVVLKANQVIHLPKGTEADPHIEPMGKGKSAVINVNINGIAQWLPLGSLNKTPHGNFAEEFLLKFPTNAELCALSNHDVRADFLIAKAEEGKALRVTEIFIGQRPVFEKSAEGGYQFARNEDNSPKTQPGNFPIFEWIDAPAE